MPYNLSLSQTRDVCIIAIIVAVLLLNIYGWAKTVVTHHRRTKRK